MCKDVPKEVCVDDVQCETRYNEKCNTVYEMVCKTNTVQKCSSSC